MSFDTYFNEIRKAMQMLVDIPNTVYVGQSVRHDGHALFRTMQTDRGSLIVPMDRRIELPVIEDFQMGYCTGLSLCGYLPISIFPRWDFLLIAANQLVNHLDKVPILSTYRPKVILRTAVGSASPLQPGPQHTQDHTEAFRKMFKTIHIITLDEPRTVYAKYCYALALPQTVLVVEYMEKYNQCVS